MRTSTGVGLYQAIQQQIGLPLVYMYILLRQDLGNTTLAGKCVQYRFSLAYCLFRIKKIKQTYICLETHILNK